MWSQTINPSELLSASLAILVLVYALINLRTLGDRRFSLLVLGLAAVAAGLVVTNLEEYLLPTFLNVVEHALMAVGALLVAMACWRMSSHGSEEGGGP